MYTNDEYGEGLGILKTISVSTDSSTDTKGIDDFFNKLGANKEHEGSILKNVAITYDANDVELEWEEVENKIINKFPDAIVKLSEGESDDTDDFGYSTEYMKVTI